MKKWTAEVWRRPIGGKFEHIMDIEIEARTERSAYNKAEKMTNPMRRVYIKSETKKNYLAEK